MKTNRIIAIITGIMITSIMSMPISSKVYAAYDGTSIDSNLNSSSTPDHITLTWTKDPKTTQTITWRTSSNIDKGLIEYTNTKTREIKKVTAGKESFSTASTDINIGNMNIFSATIENLQPGTVYNYRVGDGTNWSSINTFKTEENGYLETKFLIFGDSQSGNADVPNYAPWNKTVQNAFLKNKDADFLVNLGDLVEKGQDYRHWNNWFDAAKGVIDKIPEMPVQGNHETYNALGWDSTNPKYFVNQFKVPMNGPDGLKGQVYSYDYGNVHFVVLDSQEDEEAPNNDEFLKKQAQWLDNDLSVNKQKWTIVMFHKTPYYNKASRANVALKNIFSPVIEKHHVDVVLNGHDHGVSRTFPIKDGKYYSEYSDGTVYYVTGRSGAKYYGDLSSKVWDAFFFDPQDMPCYEVADVQGNVLSIKAYKQDGTLVDTLNIDKSNKNNSTKVILPSAYNVDMNNKELAAIGADPRLVIYGTPIAFGSNQCEIIDGESYVNPQYIALYMGGSYDSNNLKLTIGKTVYTFSNQDISKNKNVSVEALNKVGFNCEYNSQLNTVMVDK
ncbi:metallophosphoesterase family protein [Clostridiaceae bacterium UIB06]|uniref:Metallophosphoesterase family protein n=1 Tax=Clostridium thailandense TaxID=2794346 RepID=A0A949TY59_9CLOT|nr:metallophosphoesterase family protein [Clostridium thailandense]MBV7272669.1 metallophosphoesterase family protein [Clostridium thailandense]MCH5137883.1 metallophosphoesterase family protein [Clostridiaceae bacterium UIB06]